MLNNMVLAVSNDMKVGKTGLVWDGLSDHFGSILFISHLGVAFLINFRNMDRLSFCLVLRVLKYAYKCDDFVEFKSANILVIELE